MDSNLFNKYYNLTLRFLSFRPRSKKEIKEYLSRKKVDEEVVNKIIQKLEEFNFLNDEEFAKWLIEQRTKFKPRSLRLIKLELKQKGISLDIIEDQILSIWQAQDKNEKIDDLEIAKRVIEPKIHKYKNLPKHEIYRKLGSFLARRGFSYDIIKQSIDEILIKVV